MSETIQNRNETENKASGSSSGQTSTSGPTHSTSGPSKDRKEGNGQKKRKFEDRKRGENYQNQNYHHNTQQRGEWQRLTGAPAWDLPTNDPTHAQQFTGRCRLFVANLPQNVTEESLRELFGTFGQISDIYIGKGNQFAFVKMDTKQNAETAKMNLDGKPLDGRTLRVRLAAHAAAVRVSNLPPLVSNELLALAFSAFGPVERAVVSADDRGRSLGEGIVEFARKSSAQASIKKCHNECLLLSATPIPVVVTPLESRDEEEGVPEKSVTHAHEYRSEREMGPRFAETGSVEWEMALKWKQLSSIESQRKEQLETEMRDLREGLRQQMEYLKIEETTKQLREQLRRMESESEKLQMEREERMESERRREEERQRTELLLRQQEAELLRRGDNSDLGQLRRQESELRSQANALQQLLDRQEQALRQMGNPLMHPNEQLQPQLEALNGHSLAFQSQQQLPTQSQQMAPQMNSSFNQISNQFQMRAQPINQLASPQFHTRAQSGQQMGGASYGHAPHYKRNRRF